MALYFACSTDFDEPALLWEVSAHGVNEVNGFQGQILGDDQSIDRWFTNCDDKTTVGFAWPRKHNERSAAQMSVFSIASDPTQDHLPLLVHAGERLLSKQGNNWKEHTLVCYEIPAGCKREFLRQLWVRNIHSASLFPGVQGLCAYASDLVALYKYSGHEAKRKLNELLKSRPEPEVASLLTNPPT